MNLPPARAEAPSGPCSDPSSSCSRKVWFVGWCRIHYYKLTPLERFMTQVRKESTGCWVWLGKLRDNGYARISVDGTPVYSHRFAYETFKGPIAEGLTIDHLCRNRACVCPDHLEVVSGSENTSRAVPFRSADHYSKGRTKDVCKWGHSLVGYNLVIRYGARSCRECEKERAQRFKRRRREAATPEGAAASQSGDNLIPVDQLCGKLGNRES